MPDIRRDISQAMWDRYGRPRQFIFGALHAAGPVQTDDDLLRYEQMARRVWRYL